MTEKERLTELFQIAEDMRKEGGTIEESVDFLLDNGVRLKALNVGDTVYVITTCRDFPQELDGGWETATGYYCPCELRDNCPHNADCESVADTEAVFTDQITCISEYEESTGFNTSYTGYYNISQIGKTLFMTREAAEKALAERNGKK